MSPERDGVPAPDRYVLRLFVAGTAQRSRRTVESLRRFCETHLANRHELEVIDIYQQPDLAERDGVLAAPTLVRAAPLPARRITGDLLNEQRVLRGLDLASSGEEG